MLYWRLSCCTNWRKKFFSKVFEGSGGRKVPSRPDEREMGEAEGGGETWRTYFLITVSDSGPASDTPPPPKAIRQSVSSRVELQGGGQGREEEKKVNDAYDGPRVTFPPPTGNILQPIIRRSPEKREKVIPATMRGGGVHAKVLGAR